MPTTVKFGVTPVMLQPKKLANNVELMMAYNFRSLRKGQFCDYSIDIELRKDPQLSGFIIVLREKVAAGMRDPK